MSLVRTALRIAAVEALRDRTMVGDNVLDSQAGAIDFKIDGTIGTTQTRPFISVYLYDGKHERTAGELRSLFVNGRVRIAFEIGVVAGKLVRNAQGEQEAMEGIPFTDAANEFLLDLYGRQVRMALVDPDNAWAQVFNGLAGAFDEIEFAATRVAEGQRIAGHQLMISASLADDPTPGEPVDPETPFGQFLALMEASTDPLRLRQAELMRAALGPIDDRPWRVLQQSMGLTAAELLALGHGPIPQDAERATPENTAVVVDVAGTGRHEITP